MKKIVTFIISLSFVLHFNSVSTLAQSKGGAPSQGPSLNQSHGQASTHVKTTSSTHGVQSKVEWQTKLDERYKSDAAFATKMDGLLPKGMTLQAAESGFKNNGQFIAALHVSQNLGISFDQLKARMTGVTTTATGTTAATGTTGGTASTSPMSLGNAIHELKPSIPETQVNIEVKRAVSQAKETEKTKTAT